MALLILSKELVSQQDTFQTLALTALNSNLSFFKSEKAISNSGTSELNFQKYRRDKIKEQYFLLDIISQRRVEEQYQMELLHTIVNGIRYYGIAGTDNAQYPELMYDFSLAYLRLKPAQLIVIYDDYIFSLKDIEEIERTTGFTDDWYYKFKRTN